MKTSSNTDSIPKKGTFLTEILILKTEIIILKKGTFLAKHSIPENGTLKTFLQQILSYKGNIL